MGLSSVALLLLATVFLCSQTTVASLADDRAEHAQLLSRQKRLVNIDEILEGLKNTFKTTLTTVLDLNDEDFATVVQAAKVLAKPLASKILGGFTSFFRDPQFDFPNMKSFHRVEVLQNALQEADGITTTPMPPTNVLDGLQHDFFGTVSSFLGLKKEDFEKVVDGAKSLAKTAAKNLLGKFVGFFKENFDLGPDSARDAQRVQAFREALEANVNSGSTLAFSVAVVVLSLLLAAAGTLWG